VCDVDTDKLIADFIIWAILTVHNNNSMSLWSKACFEREREESLPFQHPHNIICPCFA
jgi:hypothetical protein